MYDPTDQLPTAPKQIMAEMAAVYAACQSYRDRGRVVTRFFDLSGAPTSSSERPFETAFARPDRFRFEFRERFRKREPWMRYVVWKNGAIVRTHWDVGPRDEELNSLALGLAGATGVSGGSAYTIPALLLPEVGGNKLTTLVGAKILGQVAIDGVLCHHLTARTRRLSPRSEARRDEEILAATGRPASKSKSEPTHLWIAVDTHLLRRVERTVVFETFASTSVTDYFAEVDVPIGPADLAFETTPR